MSSGTSLKKKKKKKNAITVAMTASWGEGGI
jgi:hypothetical protein